MSYIRTIYYVHIFIENLPIEPTTFTCILALQILVLWYESNVALSFSSSSSSFFQVTLKIILKYNYASLSIRLIKLLLYMELLRFS